MKKLITFLIGLIMILSVSAGAPMPAPFVLYFIYDDVAVVGLNVNFDCDGNTVTKTTNSVGGVMVNVGEGSPDFAYCSALLSVDCGYEACVKTYNLNSIDTPFTETIVLSEAPPEPEPECTLDSDCSSGYECISEECSLIPEPEPTVEDKVTSNEDNSLAIIESYLGDCVDVTIQDNKLNTLKDGIIDFDGEDYDIHEEIKLKYCIETSLDNEDYADQPFIVIPEEGVVYRYIFDDAIPKEDVEDDEPLEIVLLGKPEEIVSISDSSVTFLYGEDHKEVKIGAIIPFNGKDLEITHIGQDEDKGAYIKIRYNGETTRVYQGEIGEAGGVQVLADDIIADSDVDNIADIKVAEDVEVVVDDGDDYNEEEVWKWVITSNSIGITNQEEYSDLEELDYLPLKELDTIVLPNDYTKIQFNDLTKPKLTEFTVRVKDGYLRILGEREDSFADDYDEVYINAEGIFDEDLVLINTGKVRIGESDIYLELGSVKIGDLTIELDMSDIKYNGVSFSSKDDVYLDYQGILFKDPEEAVIDKSGFEISVPDERPEVTVTVGTKTKDKPDEECVCPKLNCTQEDCKETVCDPCDVCTQKDCETCEECVPPEPCPDTDDNILSETIAAILGAIGGAGIFFKIFNNKIFTGSNTGLKTYRGRDGTLKLLHKHPGTRGYHDPDTSHRAPETHPKGQIDVAKHYEKNSKGEWEYR